MTTTAAEEQINYSAGYVCANGKGAAKGGKIGGVQSTHALCPISAVSALASEDSILREKTA